MIESVIIKDTKETPISYLGNVFDNGTEFRFKPGINIIVGPNGSGKSTLFKLISKFGFCEEGEFSELPSNGLEWPKIFNDEGEVLDGVDVIGDWKNTIFRLRPVGDMAPDEGLKSFGNFSKLFQSKHSSTGEQTLVAVNRLLHVMFSDSSTPLEFPMDKLEKMADSSTGIWQTRTRGLVEYYKRNRREYQGKAYTILMDEPDRNLDIDNLKHIYGMLSYNREDAQMIAILHNQALVYRLCKLPGINFIETKEGYLSGLCDFVEGSFGGLGE